jgi:membrane protein YdbS with pleckstrin-like domain
VDELFASPEGGWHRVSPRLAVVRRATLVAGWLLVTAAVVVAITVLSSPVALLVAALVVLVLGLAWGWWLAGRTAARWGYAELAEDLYITRGALFRRLVVVPYGRMQFVDVHAGPLDQLAGIARVQLHTASPGTSAVIPGLPAEEAARLRDRLTSLGEAQAAGL